MKHQNFLIQLLDLLEQKAYCDIFNKAFSFIIITIVVQILIKGLNENISLLILFYFTFIFVRCKRLHTFFRQCEKLR